MWRSIYSHMGAISCIHMVIPGKQLPSKDSYFILIKNPVQCFSGSFAEEENEELPEFYEEQEWIFSF